MITAHADKTPRRVAPRREERELPRGVEGNRILLAQLAVRLNFLATVSRMTRERRLQLKRMGLKPRPEAE